MAVTVTSVTAVTSAVLGPMGPAIRQNVAADSQLTPEEENSGTGSGKAVRVAGIGGGGFVGD